MRTKRLFLSILLVLVTCCLVACGKVSVSLSGENTVKVGETIRLAPEANKKKATFSWASDNNAVATVNDGVVTGVSAGVATITVTATSGKKSAEASIKITVTADAVTNNKPVINGAVDKTIAKGSKYAPMEGITAWDEEDQDLTSQIQCTQNVKPNVVGVYDVTYSVTDSDGNTTTVTIKITVEAVDNEAPLLTGVQDKAIVVGDTLFSLTDNVIASDTVDGDLTSAIEVKGELDVWTPGEYTIEYSVKDSSNNEAKATRKITVGVGEFKFDEPADKEFTKVENDYQFAAALASINTDLAAFALAKLEFKVNAGAACELVPSITNGTAPAKIALAEGENTITVYFRISEAFAEGLVKLAAPAEASLTFSDVKFAFAEAKDTEAPVINVPSGKEIVLPGNVADADVLKKFVLEGISAQDNIDGILTSKLDVDFTGVELGNCYEDKEITIFVVDSSNNRGEAKVTAKFVKVYDTKIIKDPTFETPFEPYDATTHIGWGVNGGSGDPVIEIKDGVLVHTNQTAADPGWDSASCPFFRTTTEVLAAHNWYMLKFDVKAEVARKMTIRIGLETTEALGWIENFEGGKNTPFNITTEWQTCYVLFYVHAEVSEGGMNVIKIEFKDGSFTWGAEEKNNPVSYDNVQVYLLTNENSAPILTVNPNLPTSFGKDEAKPDLTQYVTAYDREDAEAIAITAAHITEAIDMATPGTYDVVYKVADSAGKEATITIQIKVLAEKDTVAPVLAEAEGIVKTYDQFGEAPDLTKLITANDAVDGAIEITQAMITTDADINKAGTYDVKYTVKDSSGNVAELTITLVVNDKEAPKVAGKDQVKTYVGTELTAADIIAQLTVTDNVDGPLTLTAEMVKGLDKVNFAVAGEYDITVEISDAAGNKQTFAMKVSVREKGNTIFVIGEQLLDLAPLAPEKAEVCEVTEAEGVYTIAISAIGGWASANKMKFTPDVFKQDETYILKFTAKADKARSVQFNIGEAMDGSSTGVWMEKYPLAEEGSDVVALSTEYKTFEIQFTVHNEKFEWGPTIEFCVGPVAGACENGNNIYFTELAIYSTQEVGDVDLLTATIDPQKHEVGHALAVYKAPASGNWDWISIALQDVDFTGYDKLVATVLGTQGEQILFKVNDVAEERHIMTGEMQEIEQSFNLTFDNSKPALFIMPNADTAGTGHEFLITKLEFQGEGKDPIDLLQGALNKSTPCSYQKVISLTKPTTDADAWDCAKFKVSDNLSGYAAVSYAVRGSAGTTITIKTNDNGNYSKDIALNGELQSGLIDLTGMKYNTASSAMIIFVDINKAGTGMPVYIYEMKYLVTGPEKPEPENPGHVEPTGVAQSSTDFASWDEYKTVTFSNLPTATNGGKWARWDYDSVTGDGYTDVVVQLKATPGLRINAKLDASNTPANNAYDSIAGNKTTIVAGEDGLVTFTWNLEEFAAAAEAAGKAFAVSNLRKFVVFPSCGLEGDDVFTTGSIELISIDFIKGEEPEVYVPVYPEAVEGVDLILGTINPKTIIVERQVRMTKDNGGGQWDWAGLKYAGDLTGYTKMVAQIIGPDGAAFTFKINDKVEKSVTTNGALQEVEHELDASFEWNAAAQTMIMFPDFATAGLGNEFTIVKLELQGEGKEAIDLLAAALSVSNSHVKACRDLVLTKATTNSEPWDCIEISVADDLTGYNKVHFVVKGTAGEQLLIKTNNQVEKWLGLTGEVQEDDAVFEVAYNAAQPAMVLFPNPGAAGSGNKIVISQLVFVKEGEPVNPEPEAPVYPAAIEGVDLIPGTINPKTIIVERQVRMVKDSTSGQWDWAGLKFDGDLTGYTKMVAEIIGPDGAAFTFKINDKVEKGVTTNGALQEVVHELAADFEWNASAQTMIMFPDFATAGLGNEFTIVKLELQGEGKEPIDLLAATLSVSNEHVKACRDLVLTKAADNNEPWDCIEISAPVDLAGYTKVHYVVKGTAGEQLLIKTNNQVEKWVALTGEVQEGDAEFNVAYNAAQPAMVLFPNPGAAGSGNKIVISQLVFTEKVSGLQVKYGGEKEATFEKQEDGTYVATVELAAWKRISFSTVLDGVETVLWYDNTTFTGLITAEDKLGDAWDGSLYHEADDGKRWMPGQAAGYKFTYNPETHTMHVGKYIPGGELQYGGEKQGKFVEGEGGILTATVALEQWKRISFTLVDEDGNETVLWYDNTTFTGKITAEDKLGDAWDDSLYHEEGDGKRWMPGSGAERTYKFEYNPETRTMNVILLDLVAPTITISQEVQTALASAEFFESQDASALFAQLLAGITANDDKDGAITVTQEMVNLGGLNPAALVAGDYTITITVADAAGNEAKQELKIHVKKYANENLLADLPQSNGDYKSANWTVEKYTSAWEVQTSVQMRSRASNSGVRVANMANGWGMTMRYTYSTGEALGIANKLSLKMGNYWSNAQAMSIKIKVVTTAGQDIYILGSASEFYSFHVTTDVEEIVLPFAEAEIKSVVFVTKSSVQDSTYLYIGSPLLSYVQPGTEENPYTVEQALAAAAKMGKSSSSSYVDVQHVWIKGYVVDAGLDKGDYVQNLRIASSLGGETTLLIYAANETENAKDFCVNDEVLIYGYLMNFGGTYEVGTIKVDGESQYSEYKACTRGQGTVSVADDSSEQATVKEISAQSGVNGTEFTFKVDAASGYEIESVAVNGVVLEAVEGVYTAKFNGPTKIKVLTKEEGAVTLPNLTMSGSTPTVKGGTASTNMNAQNAGYYQTAGTVTQYYYQIKADDAYFAEAPAKLVIKVVIGTGSDKDVDDANAAYVVLVDKDGNEIEGTTKMITKSFKKATEEYTIEIVPTADFAGIKIYETKVSNWNMRLYSISVEVGGEEPVSSPASFQVTNLSAEGNNRNHIEGAGAWIWIDPTSIGLTGANLNEFEVAATCETLTVSNAFLSDYSESAVRCYVLFAAAPGAEDTTVINITLTHDGVTYQGTVSFVGNELA